MEAGSLKEDILGYGALGSRDRRRHREGLPASRPGSEGVRPRLVQRCADQLDSQFANWPGTRAEA